ncbi:MAG TPA: cupin fold metalloprotein, WbuC family [Bacteroidales bacterium]|nr:cupin fold metalloprotein, WbuC family [Bacteroidales bacterium]
MIKINEAFISETSAKAKKSARSRMNFNFHKEDAATLQRMLNAMEPDTYIQPHKHENPDKVEAFFALRGRLLIVEFDDTGEITDYVVLDARTGNFGAEIAPRTWHTVISLEEGSVAYEVKDGPYDVVVDKNFAPWAPAEGDGNGKSYNLQLLKKINLAK